MRGNLFVVSRVGQLRNVQTFIHEFAATRNVLAVLYTDANPVLPSNIEKNIDASLFEEIVFIKQPDKPLVQKNSTGKRIYTQFEELLLSATSRHGVENLFLCNTDNYYGLLGKVARDHGLALTMNLLEEGLGTYSIAGAREYRKHSAVDWTEVRFRGRNALEALERAARMLLILAATVVTWIIRVDLFALRNNGLEGVLVSEKYRYREIEHFDNAFVYFPDKVHSGKVVIDHVEGLGFSLKPTASPEVLDAIPDRSVLFVSQKYLASDVYFAIVFRVLAEMGVERVFVKLHPRESRAAFSKAWEAYLAERPRFEVVCNDDIQAVPAEELMMAGKVERVIGLTSTSLVYAKAFFPDVEVVSIARRFRELAVSPEFGVSNKSLGEFTRDLEIFLDVAEIEQF